MGKTSGEVSTAPELRPSWASAISGTATIATSATALMTSFRPKLDSAFITFLSTSVTMQFNRAEGAWFLLGKNTQSAGTNDHPYRSASLLNTKRRPT
jgi:hypothetical protein